MTKYDDITNYDQILQYHQVWPSMTKYDPQDSGRLSKSSTIELPVAVDNIEYDDQSGEIIVGQFSFLKNQIWFFL